MKKENIMTGIIGLLLGVIVTGFAAGQAVNNNNSGMMRMMGIDSDMMHHNSAVSDEMSMSAMTQALKTKTGDDFDKAFLEMMIDHHEGAVNMAKLSAKQAKHDEVKQLSLDIIAAQENEISKMQQWQKNWGYQSDNSMDMMRGHN